MSKGTVPRTGGDKPQVGGDISTELSLFPAQAGINRIWCRAVAPA